MALVALVACTRPPPPSERRVRTDALAAFLGEAILRFSAVFGRT